MRPIQFHRLSLARITTSIVGSQASSAMARPVILDNIFETVPCIFRFSCSDNLQDSHLYRTVDTTDAFRMRRRSPFGSLEGVKTREIGVILKHMQ